MNTNPNAFTEPVISNLFSTSIIRHTQNNGQILDAECKQAGSWVQYFASLTTVEWYGDKYLWRAGYYDRFYQNAYRTELRELMQVLDATRDNPDLINQYSIARIWRVEILHRVTDLYGDVPYFEAGLGYLEGIYKPKYDRQPDIYADMLKELEEAATSLDASKASYSSADFLYNGDVDKWRKYAYSMMLRLGMRLTKVDAALAESWVTKAIAGGVMQNNEDIAYLRHTSQTNTNWNTISQVLQGGEGVPLSAKGKGIMKMNKTFIDYLKATSDPRISFYATLWQGNADVTQVDQHSAPELQQGLPGGNDQITIKNAIPEWTSDMLANYSEPNLHTVAHLETPSIFQSYAEVQFLLAEAALRGWTSGDTKTYYENAVRAAFAMQSIFPNAPSAGQSDADATSYLAANPYQAGDFNQQMQQIHTQFWVSLFGCNMEVYANWRRTGYPALTPYNFPANETGGVIPRRSRYPTIETSLNTVNYTAAVAQQGPDLFTTRVWWDKE